MASATQKVLLEKEKDTKRYTKYNFPEPFTGSLYVPVDANNPDTIEVAITVRTNGSK